MKKRLFTLAGGIILVATVAKIIAIPAVAQTIRAAFVKNIDEKGRNPYALSTTCAFDNISCTYSFPQVPSGMRFVVENINAVFYATDGASVDLKFSVAGGGGVVYHFPAVNGYQYSGYATYYVNAPITAFVNDGSVPWVSAYLSQGTFSGNGAITLTGYLVNLNN